MGEELLPVANASQTRGKAQGKKTGPGARPLIEDREKINKFFNALSAGNYPKIALQFARISQSAYYSWLARANAERQRLIDIEEETGIWEEPLEAEKIYLEFLDDLEAVEAEAEVRMVTYVASAARKDWRAATSLIERRWKKRWSQKTEVSGELEVKLVTGAELGRKIGAMLDTETLADEADPLADV